MQIKTITLKTSEKGEKNYLLYYFINKKEN